MQMFIVICAVEMKSRQQIDQMRVIKQAPPSQLAKNASDEVQFTES